FFAMIIYGFGFAFIFPSMNKVIADASSKVDRGKAYGVFYAFFSFGVVIGSYASGWFAGILGLPFIMCALVMFISVAVITIIEKKRPSSVYILRVNLPSFTDDAVIVAI